MKKIIKILSFNTGLLLVLLIILEIILRLAGMDTIVEMEKKMPGREKQYRAVCEKILTHKLEYFNSFYTDSEGIFKANPAYFADSKNKKSENISINREGFRGNPFEYVGTSRPKILLIGDSFTWGGSAKPLTNSFADLLEAAGYYVYNGGIPGTDPQQYAMIAGKYTPLLKPDIVAVCVYMGNDVSTRPLVIKPNKNLHYVTNFGFLKGYDDSGHYFKDAQEAFEYLKKRKCGCGVGLGDYVLLKTVIGKGIYGLITRENQAQRFDATKKWVRDSLQRIQDICIKNDSKFIIFLIPSKNQDTQKNKTIQKNLPLFNGFSYYYPENIEKSDYCEPPNNHFNTQGHRKYADFIIGVLKQKGFDKKTTQ